jgi:hypothetical protein
VLSADEAERRRLRLLGGRLHRREQLYYLPLVVGEVREVREAFSHLLDDSLRLRRGGQSLKLPDELSERQVAPTLAGVGYVAKDQHLERLGTIPVRTGRLARNVLLEWPLVGRFVNFGVF